MCYTLITISVFIRILLTHERVPYHSVICRLHCSVHGIEVAERSLKRDSFLIGKKPKTRQFPNRKEAKNEIVS